MRKVYIKLIALSLTLALSVTMVVAASYAWLVLSRSPEVSGIQVTIGGGNTILVAADVTQTVNGQVYHYPDYFADTLNFSRHSSYAYLQTLDGLMPVSTADGIHWFLPTYYAGTDEEVKEGKALAGELKDISQFTMELDFAHANLSGVKTIPYNAKVEKSDGKGNVTRTTYNNGYKFCVKSYKNSALTQEDFYEDVFGSRHSKPHKRTSVRKYSSTDESKAQQYVSFQISRNHDECWNKNPQIEMYKKEGDSLLRVNFHVPSKGKTGAIYATKKENEKETRGTIFLYQDGTRHNFSNNNNALILNSLLELRETIQSAEFKADFGFNNKFNSELDKAIDSLLV